MGNTMGLRNMEGDLDGEAIVRLIRDTTAALFATMMHGQPEALPHYCTSASVEDHESLFCFIGFSGEVVGSGSLHCSGECATRLASSLLMGDYKRVDAEVLDATAEITNMIVGNVKTSIEEELGPIGISTPTVIYGQHYAARNIGASEWIVVPFRYEGHEFDIRVSLQPNKTSRTTLTHAPRYHQAPSK